MTQNNKKPIFVDGVHEYDVEIKGDTYTLYHSNSAIWAENVKGKVTFEIENTGNSYIITQEKKGKLDYSEFFELGLLMKFMKDDGVNQGTIQLGELTNI